MPCPESRSEALRFFAGDEIEVEVEVLPLLSVACSFFQLLERPFVSIPTYLISAKAKTLSEVNDQERVARELFLTAKKRALKTDTAF